MLTNLFVSLKFGNTLPCDCQFQGLCLSFSPQKLKEDFSNWNSSSRVFISVWWFLRVIWTHSCISSACFIYWSQHHWTSWCGGLCNFLCCRTENRAGGWKEVIQSFFKWCSDRKQTGQHGSVLTSSGLLRSDFTSARFELGWKGYVDVSPNVSAWKERSQWQQS